MHKIKRDRSEEIRKCPPPSKPLADSMKRPFDLSKETLKSPFNDKEEPNKLRTNSAKRENDSKARPISSKPPIGKKPSIKPNLNQTEEIKTKLPPKAPLSTKNSTTSLLRTFNKDDIIGTGNIDNYQIGNQIGQGAYAIVRSAIFRPTNRKVALKTYEKSKLLDAHRKRCVKREIDVLQILTHPNIVKLIEVIESSKHIHIAMEYIGGNSLHSYIKKRPNRKLDEPEVHRIFKQTLQAIEYIHSMNVTHRDIKLENILLDEENNVKIIDFGFATCFSHEMKVKIFCGTPSYMAPEIVSRSEYSGPPADMWALGILLYVMTCGCYPFKAQADKELYNKIQLGQFVLPASVSQGTRSIISRLLKLSPEKRPSASDLLKDVWVVEEKLDGCFEGIGEILPKANSAGDSFDAEVIFSLKKFGYTDDELKVDLMNEKSRASLLYRHLKRSKAESSTGSFHNGNNLSAGFA